jgi:hypothetical protein
MVACHKPLAGGAFANYDPSRQKAHVFQPWAEWREANICFGL